MADSSSSSASSMPTLSPSPAKPELKIREATLADAPALSALKVQTFRETFVDPPEKGGFGIPYPATELAAFEKECYDVPVVEGEIKGGKDGRTRVWVVVSIVAAPEEEELVGYLKVGTAKLPHPEVPTEAEIKEGKRSEEGEVCQLYLKRGYQDRGMGRQLMETALSYIEATYGREKQVWVGVWSGNDKAQRFYRRYGFSKVGEYFFAVGQHKDHEFIFRREAPGENVPASS